MSISSSFFLIGLLPWFLGLYRIVSEKSRVFKIVLLAIANSLFYLWSGVGAFVFLLLYSAIIWLLTLLLKKAKRKLYLIVSVIMASAPLLFVKYSGLFISACNALLDYSCKLPVIFVPLGISFFTFEAISLLVDVYSGKVTESSIIYIYIYGVLPDCYFRSPAAL